MSQTKLVVSIVVACALVIVGYMFFRNKSESGSILEEVNSEQTQNTRESGKKTAFSEFLKQGGSYRCTVNQSVNGTDTEGIVYVNGNMIRGEYNTKVQGMSIDSTMIVRDGYTYNWTSMAPNMGFKAKVAVSGGNSSTGTSGTYSFNSEEIGDYNCETWTVDASKFVLPSGVSFKEV
jgi:hypothetical protein